MDYALALDIKNELGTFSVYAKWINDKLKEQHRLSDVVIHTICLEDLETLSFKIRDMFLDYDNIPISLSDKEIRLLSNLSVYCERIIDNFSHVDDEDYMNTIAEISITSSYYGY